jgi:hypothetical protein
MTGFKLNADEKSLLNITILYNPPKKGRFLCELYITNQRFLLIISKNLVNISTLIDSLGLTNAEIIEEEKNILIEIKRDIIKNYVFSLNSIAMNLIDGSLHTFSTSIQTLKEPIVDAIKNSEPEEKIIIAYDLANYIRIKKEKQQKRIDNLPKRRKTIFTIFLSSLFLFLVILVIKIFPEVSDYLKSHEIEQVKQYYCKRCNKLIREEKEKIKTISEKTVDTIKYNNEIHDSCRIIYNNQYFNLANNSLDKKDYSKAKDYAEKSKYYGNKLADNILNKINEIMSKQYYDTASNFYNKKKYSEAKNFAKKSIDLGNKNAGILLNKIDEMESKKKALEELASKKYDRLSYSEKLREHFLDNQTDIKVTVWGNYNENIKLTYIFIGDVWAHDFEKGDLKKEIESYEFKKIYLSNGFNYNVYYSY